VAGHTSFQQYGLNDASEHGLLYQRAGSPDRGNGT